MKTIRILFILIFSLAGIMTYAAESAITKVTVYRQGAKISRTIKINVKSGNQEIILDNLTSTIDANSLQVGIRGKAILLSASVRNNYIGYKTLPGRLRELKDSLELLIDRIDWVNNEQTIYKGEEKLIHDNQKIVNEKQKITATDIAQLADFYRSRLFTLRKKIYTNAIKLRKTREKKQKIEKQLQELNYQNGQQMGEIVLSVSADQATQIILDITYLSRSAGWSPIYDIRCAGISGPLDLVYKANVYQNTGYDWKGINLVISTGNPTANNNRPVMSPWYIDFLQPVQIRGQASVQKSSRQIPQSSNMMMEIVDMKYDQAPAPPVPYEVSAVTNQMTSEYDIRVKQDIPSDGKQHLVAIRNIELPAVYSYHTAPKLDQHAFLIARIGDYGKYDLLSGQTNIFFEGMYVGQTYLNPEATGDSLIVSLGRDDRINIQRNILTDFTSAKTIGINKKVEKGYEIIIRNNKSTEVSLEVLDQVPLSRNKDIEVEIEDMGGAKYSEDYGKLLWKIKMAPGATKKIRFVYSVKHPKSKQVSGI